jgi:predicted signal transduction protein with EAL and GGDEF domain
MGVQDHPLGRRRICVTVAARTPSGVESQLETILARQTRTGRAMSTLAIPMVAGVLIGQMPSSALAAWSLLMVLEATADLVIARPRTERIASGADDPTWRRRMLPHYVSFGLVWGSLPVFALVGGEPEPLWLAIVMVLAVLTVYVVTTAASRLLFTIGAVGIMAQMAAAIALSDTIPMRLGLLAVAYVGIAFVVHDALHRHLVDSVRSRHVAEELALQLNRFLADRDPATQLLNRRSFIGTLDAVLAERPNRSVYVEVANVRRLTAINELYGEQFGDAVIAHVGRCLAAIDPGRGVAARLSGDEFALVVLGGDPDLSIRSVAAGTFTWSGLTTTLDFSCATSNHAGAGSTAEGMVADAVFALRADGGDRASGRVLRSGDSAGARRELVEELQAGLYEAGVRPWFQPIVDADTRSVVAWEALVRWAHPELGTISPDRLLPLLDMSGMNSELLELIVVGSLDFLSQLDAMGAHGHLVHVNVNPSDLREVSMPDAVLGAIHDSGIAADRLVLELTEREILHVDHVVRGALGRLDLAGVQVAVDDFGTGYSSLSHLLDFPADDVKIDRRFVTDLPDDPDALALVRGVVSMARGLGLRTVAEGVETEGAAQVLHQLGCDQLQGYLFAPALAADAAVAWWATHEASLPAASSTQLV